MPLSQCPIFLHFLFHEFIFQNYNIVLVYFYCYTVHVVELLNYYTNHCTYINFINFMYVQWLA